jgi:hypothetical protein
MISPPERRQPAADQRATEASDSQAEEDVGKQAFAFWPIMSHDQIVQEAELMLAVDVEPEYSQIMMSVVGCDPNEPGAWPEWAGDVGAVSGSRAVLVATWSDDNDPVAVSVYRGRPLLDEWSHVHTARLIVGIGGLAVGMTVSAVEHTVPAPQGPMNVEVWVRPAAWPGEVTFVLQH